MLAHISTAFWGHFERGLTKMKGMTAHRFNYSEELAHVKVVINCQNSIAQMCTREDLLARLYERSVRAFAYSFIHKCIFNPLFEQWIKNQTTVSSFRMVGCHFDIQKPRLFENQGCFSNLKIKLVRYSEPDYIRQYDLEKRPNTSVFKLGF